VLFSILCHSFHFYVWTWIKKVWLHFLVKAWGFLEFGQDRWGELAKNASDWNNDKTFEENTEGWGFCPGSELRPGVDIAPHLTASSDPAMVRLEKNHRLYLNLSPEMLYSLFDLPFFGLLCLA